MSEEEDREPDPFEKIVSLLAEMDTVQIGSDGVGTLLYQVPTRGSSSVQ